MDVNYGASELHRLIFFWVRVVVVCECFIGIYFWEGREVSLGHIVYMI